MGSTAPIDSRKANRPIALGEYRVRQKTYSSSLASSHPQIPRKRRFVDLPAHRLRASPETAPPLAEYVDSYTSPPRAMPPVAASAFPGTTPRHARAARSDTHSELMPRSQ